MDGQDTRRYLSNNQPQGRIITPPSRQDDAFQIPNTHAQLTNNSPYNQTHLPTSNPAEHIQGNDTITYTASDEATSNQTAQQTETPRQQPSLTREQLAQYHTAWQNYYQKYYENYYIAALQEQEKRFAQQQAAIVDSREPDGVLEQSEVQERLQSDIANKLGQKTKRVRSQIWFWPLVIALVVVAIFLFLQFNSVISAKIVSFLSPGSSSSQTIIVGTGENTPVSPEPRIIIPKINVNAPVVYGLTSLDENSVQTALQNGPVNYPVAGATALPGQKGNTVILGHSSADVFAPGDYKFIFVQLNRLVAGDLFYLDYGDHRYTYKITDTKIINPDQISELNLGTDKPYATLVTCDPPGSIAKRLLVIAEQVSPDPNQASAEQQTNTSPVTTITGKPKTILENIFW